MNVPVIANLQGRAGKRFRRGRWLAVAALAAFAGSAGAQPPPKDDARRAQEAAARKAAELARLRALEAARRVEAKVAVAQQAWPDAQFEQWVFPQDRTAAGARRRLDSQLAVKINEIDGACKLTDQQAKKLRLAGRGDIKRFFDGYEKVKQKFRSLNNDVQRLQDVMPDINPLRASLQAGLFDNDSLLTKSLRNTLTAEQFERYDAVVRERRAYRHRATVERAVAMIEQQGAPLRAAQRRDLITLLMNETRPSRAPGQYDFYLVMIQLGRLPEEKMKPLLSETQWKVLTRLVDRYRQVEPALRQQGLLADEDDGDDRAEDARPAAPRERPPAGAPKGGES
jgi:hypothetical protein